LNFDLIKEIEDKLANADVTLKICSFTDTSIDLTLTGDVDKINEIFNEYHNLITSELKPE
jgi:hypothetical protein